MQQKTFSTFLIMLVIFGGTANAKKANGFYITNVGDTIKASFRFEESNLALGIFCLEGEKKILLEPTKVKLIMMDLGDRQFKFVSRSDVVKFYNTTKGIFIERKDILLGDTAHQHPVFMKVIYDKAGITFGQLNYYYNGIKYNDLVLQKDNGSLYYFKSMPIKKEMLAYFNDCPEVQQQIKATQKAFPPVEEFVTKLLKTYTTNCVQKNLTNSQ